MFTNYETFEFPGGGHVILVAPFFSDIDISYGTGRIRYEVHTLKSSEAIFSDINMIINDQMKTEFSGTWLLLAEWRNVPKFAGLQFIVRFSIHLACMAILNNWTLVKVFSSIELGQGIYA